MMHSFDLPVFRHINCDGWSNVLGEGSIADEAQKSHEGWTGDHRNWQNTEWSKEALRLGQLILDRQNHRLAFECIGQNSLNSKF